MNVQKRVVTLLLRGVGIALALLWFVPQDSAARVSVPLFFQAPPVVTVPGLMGYWPLDTAPGSLTPDLSGNGNAGTLSGGVAIDSTNKAAVPAGNPASLSLTGTSGLVTVTDSPSLSLTGSLTLAAWIRPTAAPGGTQRGILEKWDNGAPAENGYMLRLDSNNNLSFAVCSATNNTGISTAPRAVSSSGGWTHVAATYDSTTNAMVMYVGGNPDPTTGTDSTGLPTNGTSDLHIGADYGGNRFAGNIDEARIYSKALTQTEIGVLINGQPAPTGLVAAGAAGQVNLTWSAPVGTLPSTTYSILRGTATGTYTTVFNGISGTSYADTTVTAGTPYFYTVVAVTVMTSPVSNESSATASAGPPPSPSGGQKGGKAEMNPCSSATAQFDSLPFGLLAAMLAGAILLGWPRRAGGA